MEGSAQVRKMESLLLEMAEILIRDGNFRSHGSSPEEIYSFSTPLFLEGALYTKMLQVHRDVKDSLDLLAREMRRKRNLCEELLALGTPLDMEFLLMDHGYKSLLPILRSDLALDSEGRVFLLEVNCGCPGGELDPAIVADAYFRASRQSPTGIFLDPRGESLETILGCYEEFREGRPHFPEKPRIALVTSKAQRWFMLPECRGIADYYRAMGSETSVGELGELDFRDGKLHLRGDPIDLLFRKFSTQSFKLRLLEPENFPEEAHGARSLWRALEGSALCMVNPLASTFFQDKGLLPLLRKEFPRLRDVIPETHILRGDLPQSDPSLYEEILRGGSFVLKRRMSFSGRHVIMAPQEVGRRLPQLIEEEPNRWIAQRRVDPAKGFFGVFSRGELKAGNFPFVVSLFGGSAFVRVGSGTSPHEPINAHMGSATTFLLTQEGDHRVQGRAHDLEPHSQRPLHFSPWNSS